MKVSTHQVSRRQVALAVVAAGAAAALAAPAANAATTCSFSAKARSLTAAMTAPGDRAEFSRSFQDIVVRNRDGGVVSCGGSPTVTNVDTITVRDSSTGDTSVAIVWPNLFGPGVADEAGGGDPEIEFNLLLGEGSVDELDLVGTLGHEAIRFGDSAGEGRINPNAYPTEAVPDADIRTAGVERFLADGGQGNDVLNGVGGAGTGAPFRQILVLLGGYGQDQLATGDGGGGLTGDAGNDELLGRGGFETLRGGPGDDVLDGGEGAQDRAVYSAAGRVLVDLGAAGPQNTLGAGVDTIGNVEDVEGSANDDTLIGSAARNWLSGMGGKDTLMGQGGNDVLDGGNGSDFASYQKAPVGVRVDLAIQGPGATQDTIGAGIDELRSLENLTGSPFQDSLRGDGNPNIINGLTGRDTIRSFAGDDRLQIRDGGLDNAGCGAGADRVIADRAGVDTIAADCETREFAP
jgi:Ca2+-binding RTX toxin-like protein